MGRPPHPAAGGVTILLAVRLKERRVPGKIVALITHSPPARRSCGPSPPERAGRARVSRRQGSRGRAVLRWPIAASGDWFGDVVGKVLSVRRFPVSAEGDLGRGPLVPAVWPVLPGVEELLAERGVTVDHVTVYRWVQRFTPEFIEAARFCRHAPGNRWFADETYVKVAGRWTYLYRAIDQQGQVIDMLLSDRRDLATARRFFTRVLRAGTIPAEVTTDRAPAYLRVLDELIPSALHTVERYANNPVEADHGRLKARLRPMRGLRRRRSARILAAGHAFVQNLRRGHYELATDVPARHRVRTAFDQLATAI